MEVKERQLLAMINRFQLRLNDETSYTIDLEAQVDVLNEQKEAFEKKIKLLEAKPKTDYARISEEQTKYKQKYEEIISELKLEISKQNQDHKREMDQINKLMEMKSKSQIDYSNLEREVISLRKDKERLETALMELTSAHMKLKGVEDNN